MYAPTDAKAGKPWEGRFHSIVHPVTAAHIAVMGNVFGRYVYIPIQQYTTAITAL